MIRGLLLNLVVFGGYLLGAAMISVLPNVITLARLLSVPLLVNILSNHDHQLDF